MTPHDLPAILQTNADGTFRILVAADLHTDNDEAANARTWGDIKTLLNRFEPNLLVVLGDVWCGDNQPDRAVEWMRRDLTVLDGLGVPWAFVWGNHDYGVDTDWGRASVAAAARSIISCGDGRGNCRAEVVRSCDREPLWDLFFLNSHTLCLMPEDIAWFEQETRRMQAKRGRLLPALAFFHIPLKQYETARLEGRVEGIALEEASYWGDDGTRIEGLVRPGNIRACFVGHSHNNDYHFKQDGVVFAYARATGYGGYGAETVPKGAKLIVLGPEQDRFDFGTVFAEPDRASRIPGPTGAPPEKRQCGSHAFPRDRVTGVYWS